MDLSNVYESQGDFKTAIEYQHQALAVAKEVGNKVLEGTAYTYLGNAHSSLSDFKKAIEYYQQALSIFGPWWKAWGWGRASIPGKALT